jgi:hypothetical protein
VESKANNSFAAYLRRKTVLSMNSKLPQSNDSTRVRSDRRQVMRVSMAHLLCAAIV